MAYQIIQLPLRLKFQEMSRQELREFSAWYAQITPERLRTLAEAVRSTPGYEGWEADCSPDSLETLGEWFATQAEDRPLAPGEFERIPKYFPLPVTPQDRPLTDRTFSLAIDISMYLGQTLLRNHPTLRWGPPLRAKSHVDYGPPVLMGFVGDVPFSPFRMMLSFAVRLARKLDTGEYLRRIYGVMSRQVAAEAGDRGDTGQSPVL